MRFFNGLLAAILWVGVSATPVLSGDRPLVVVELFTSQGCSSCPPADELLAQLATRDDVLALALHVDYWDYIGWPDTFARPEHGQRQKAYAQEAGMRSVYTPQMVVGGVDHVIGTKPMELADYIDMSRDKPLRVSLMATKQAGTLRLEAKSATHTPLPDQMVAVLVTFTALESVKIRRGENAGTTLNYVNVVTAIVELGVWDGQGVFTLDTELASEVAGDGPAAVLIQAAGQSGGLGEILAAIRVR